MCIRVHGYFCARMYRGVCIHVCHLYVCSLCMHVYMYVYVCVHICVYVFSVHVLHLCVCARMCE